MEGTFWEFYFSFRGAGTRLYPPSPPLACPPQGLRGSTAAYFALAGSLCLAGLLGYLLWLPRLDVVAFHRQKSEMGGWVGGGGQRSQMGVFFGGGGRCHNIMGGVRMWVWVGGGEGASIKVQVGRHDRRVGACVLGCA